MSHPKNADYQADLRQRRKDAGIVPVQVYVHETRRDEIRAAAAAMQTPWTGGESIDVLDEQESKG